VEEFAESYVMGHLSPDQVVAFEEHYLTCDGCAFAVQQAILYVTAMRSAAAEFRGAPVRRAGAI
jgi:anti-sigma factor RsiW